MRVVQIIAAGGKREQAQTPLFGRLEGKERFSFLLFADPRGIGFAPVE
jgi:hypothetical protein